MSVLSSRGEGGSLRPTDRQLPLLGGRMGGDAAMHWSTLVQSNPVPRTSSKSPSQTSGGVSSMQERVLPRSFLLALRSVLVLRPLNHITEQLLALSLRRSEATAARSGLPGMCEILLLPRGTLLRLTFLLFLLMHASVATWKMSLTLFSDCWAEHSM